METQPEPKKQSAIEFAKAKLALNPEASFADVKAQAKFEGIPLFPVVYGRAKALLGLVPTAPYGSKSKARKLAAMEKVAVADSAPQSAKPTPVSPSTGANGNGENRTTRAKSMAARVAAKGDPAASLEAMIEDLRTAVQERDRYHAVLEKIAALIQSELAGR